MDDRPGRLRVATGIAHPVFNGVYRTALRSSEADAYIDETLAYFAANGLPWRWWVWPSTKPARAALVRSPVICGMGRPRRACVVRYLSSSELVPQEGPHATERA